MSESEAERQLRVHHERECRRIAELVKKELPESRLFVLVTATVGGGPEAKFSSMDYVSTIEREDSFRLLCELLDRWQESGIATEPTVKTATFVRENVHALRDVPVSELLKGARYSVRDGAEAYSAGDRKKACAMFGKLMVEATALFGRLQREEGS